MSQKIQQRVAEVPVEALENFCLEPRARTPISNDGRVTVARAADVGGVEVWRFHEIRRRWRVYHWAYCIICSDDPTTSAGSYWYRGSTWRLPRGALAIFAPGEVNMCLDDLAPPNFFAVMVAPERLGSETRRYCNAIGKCIIQHQLSGPAIRNLLDDLCECIEAPEGDSLRREHRLHAFLRALRGSPPSENTAKLEGKSRGVQRAREFLHEDVECNLSLDEVAAASGLCKFYLERAFVKQVGVPLFEYRRLVRLGRAFELIRRGTPLAEVAAMTGFVDQAHLTRVMKNCFGVTPGAYRRGGLALGT